MEPEDQTESVTKYLLPTVAAPYEGRKLVSNKRLDEEELCINTSKELSI